MNCCLVVSTILKNDGVCQLGFLFPTEWKNKKCSKPPTRLKSPTGPTPTHWYGYRLATATAWVFQTPKNLVFFEVRRMFTAGIPEFFHCSLTRPGLVRQDLLVLLGRLIIVGSADESWAGELGELGAHHDVTIWNSHRDLRCFNGTYNCWFNGTWWLIPRLVSGL